MRVVLDTNIVLVSIPPFSPYRIINSALLDMKYELLLSNEVFMEYEEIISLKANALVAENTLTSILTLENILRQEIFYNWNLITVDPDDNKFCDLYVAGDGDYLVTNDAHFNVLKTISFPKINVIHPDEFVKILAAL